MRKKLYSSIITIIAIMWNVHRVSAISEIYNIGDNALYDVGSMIAGYIVYIAIVISVVVLMMKGIKYITSAPEGKAEVKKEILPWMIGLVILFSINTILQFIADFAQKNVNNLTI